VPYNCVSEANQLSCNDISFLALVCFDADWLITDVVSTIDELQT